MSSSGPSPICSIYLIWGHPEEGLQHVGPGLGFEDLQSYILGMPSVQGLSGKQQ